jgi:hypothetical protein
MELKITLATSREEE